MFDAPKLAIVVPCYNEEAVLPETRQRLTALIRQLIDIGKIAMTSTIYFVDDGSRDRTWSLIERFAAEDRNIRGIKLSRNRGHQNALVAGLVTAEGDVIVSIDADLQDDVQAISEMLDRHRAGAEIVYGVRRRRETDSPFKRVTAEMFYAFLSL